jgi:hypothetical protein
MVLLFSFKNIKLINYIWSHDSSVGTVLGYELDDWGLIPGGGHEFFSSPPRPEQLWGPPSLLSNG